jgi:PST family polysaccharide transporter
VSHDGRHHGLSRGELREAALIGVRWLVVGRLIVEAAAFAGSVIAARLISPAEYGAAAPAAFVLVVGGGLVGGSFGSPLVRAKAVTPRLAGTALTLSIVTGLLGTLAFVGAVRAIDFGFSDRTVLLLEIVAPTLFIYSLGAVSQALIERDLDFRRGSLNDVVAVLPGTVTTVVLAIAGLGGAALAIGYVVQAAFTTGQVLYWRPPPLPRFDRRAARHIIAFGAPTSGSSLLFEAERNVAYALLGSRLPAAQTGFFWRASTLAIDYQTKVSQILLRMMFPLLSRSRDEGDMRAVRGRMVKVHTATLFPLLACLVVIAPTFVPWLYGARWAEAGPAAQILAVAGATAVVGTGTGPLLMAMGRPTALVISNAASLALFVVVVVLAAPHGLLFTCAAISAFRVVQLVVVQYLLVERLCAIPLRETLVRDVVPALAGCVALAVVAVPVQAGLGAAGAPDIVTMAAACGTGLAAYLVALRLVSPATWRDCRTMAGRVVPSRALRRARQPVAAG